MARISINDIKTTLATDGWELVSEEYKNLDTNLEFKCNKGHVVCAPWKRIRENRTCPTCMRERLKTKEFKNTKKKPGDFRILVLDQATHISGYAVYNNKNLIDYGSFEATGETDTERSL